MAEMDVTEEILCAVCEKAKARRAVEEMRERAARAADAIAYKYEEFPADHAYRFAAYEVESMDDPHDWD